MFTKKSIFILLFVSLMLVNFLLGQESQRNDKLIKKIADIDTTMWKYLSATDRSEWTITPEDSERAYREYLINGAKLFRDFNNEYKKIEKGILTIEEATPKLINILEEVKDFFEEGIKLNPFETTIRKGITTVYTYLEGFYARRKDDVNELQMIKNLLIVGQGRSKQIDLFNRAGNIYFKYNLWQGAKENFHNAVTTIFEGEEAEIDTTKLFNNIYLRGIAQLRLYEDEPALTSFTYARMITPNKKFYDNLTGYIDFINWDDGNIRASEKYRDAQNSFRERNFDNAEKVYLELLPIINTENAKNQAQLDLARIQFNYLNKKEEAIDRLWHVVTKYPLDPITGIPIDSTKGNFWLIYSQMCLQMGIDYFNTNKKFSFAYLLKSSQIESSARGKAFLNLAIISLNNPLICIDFCNHALEYCEKLNSEEQKLLYDTFYKAYLKQGNFEDALKWFKKYHEI